MNSFELITKFLPRAIDRYFFEDAKTAILEQGSKFIDVNFTETGYVKIATLLMDGLSDYYKTQEMPRPSDPAGYAAYAGNLGEGQRDGFDIGGMDLTWEIYKLQYCRSRQFRIDYISNEQTAGAIIGNAVEEFNRTKVVPEVDACRFSLMANACSVSLGNLKVDAIAANTIIHNFNSAFEWLTEHEVPSEEQVIFVSPAVMTLIRNTEELKKLLTQADFRSPSGLSFTVDKYEGRPIIEVPSNRFLTDVVTTRNGYASSTNSKIINYMICSVKAVVPIRKLEWNKLYGPEQSGLAGFHGYLINYLLWHGVIIPKNKVAGIYTSVSETAAATKVFTLAVDTRPGAATQNSWVLRNYFTNPNGLRGTIYMSTTTAFTLGAELDDVDDAEAVTMGVEKVTSGTSAYFGLVDASGKVIATTGSTAVTLSKHA